MKDNDDYRTVTLTNSELAALCILVGWASRGYRDHVGPDMADKASDLVRCAVAALDRCIEADVLILNAKGIQS